MNILYINHYAGSLQHGFQYRPFYFARDWNHKGHKVTIIASSYSHTREVNWEQDEPLREEVIDGVDYVWIKGQDYEGNGVQRALSMAKFVGYLWRRAAYFAKTYKPDAIITSSTYPLDHYAGCRIAKKSGARLIHEVHDLWPLSPMEIGQMKPTNPFIMVMQKAENDAYRRSDAVVSLLPNALDHMKKHGLSEDRYAHIPNGVVLEDWADERREPLPADVEARLDKLKAEGRFLVGYAGGHAKSNAMVYFIEAAQYLKDLPITLVDVGRGVEKPKLVARAQDLGLDNIVFIDPVKKTQIQSLLQKFDAAYLGWNQTPLYEYGTSPNKIYDYMMASLPVVHAFDYPYDLVQIAGCGITTPAMTDPKAIAAAIREMYGLADEQREEMGKRGHEYIMTHNTYDILSEKFLSVLKKPRSSFDVRD